MVAGEGEEVIVRGNEENKISKQTKAMKSNLHI
jgi:hypothetical protein